MKKKYKEGVDYRLVNYNDYGMAVHLIGQPYKDVLYSYSGAKLIEEGELFRLQFGYQILDSSNFSREELENSEKFQEMIGDILTEIVVEYNEKTRNDNPEELDIE